MMRGKPLRGGKTHPLSDSALSCLKALSRGPIPTQQINSGIVDRLSGREVLLAEVVSLPSPYVSHKGRGIPHLRLNDAGRAALAAAGAFVRKGFA